MVSGGMLGGAIGAVAAYTPPQSPPPPSGKATRDRDGLEAAYCRAGERANGGLM